MQLTNFKYYIFKVIKEGNRLQKYDVNGDLLTIKWYGSTQNLAFVGGALSIFLLPTGFADNFSGYTISFLGIFIGLFTSIIISMYEKSKTLLVNFTEKDQTEKARILQVKNYLVQFTGLTSYAIVLALFAIVLLLLSLSNNIIKTDIWRYEFVKSTKDIHWVNVLYFIKVIILILYRFLTIYLLINYFFITIFSVTSYFTFLLSEYNRLKNIHDKF